ncbi:MAG: PAS domain S-box protein [Betaproteobacteria bacterium]|nr:PAS domain S-box protein [Betaproteobacteria bacterium]
MAIVAVPFVIFQAAETVQQFERNRRDSQLQALNLARVIGARLDDFVGNMDAMLLAVSTAAGPAAGDIEATEKFLVALKTRMPGYVNNIKLNSPEGGYLGSSSQRRDLVATEREYLTRALQTDGLAIGEPVISRATNVWTLALARRVTDNQGRLVAVASVSTRLQKLDELLDPGDLPDGTVMTLLNEKGVVLEGTAESEKWVGQDISSRPIVQRLLAAREGALDEESIDGVRRLSAFTTAQRVPWIVYVGIPRERAYAPMWQALWRHLVEGAIVLALAVAAAWVFAARMARPLQELTQDIARLGAGDLDYRSSVRSGNEVGRLATAFNDMADKLTQREQMLRESEQHYRLLFEASPLPMWVRDEKTLQFLAVNQAAIGKYGYTREDFQRMTTLDTRPASDRESYLEELRQRDPDAIVTVLRRHVTKDGRVINVEVTSRPFTFGGKAARLSLANDVTERVRAERALRESEERLRTVVDHLGEGIGLYDREDRLALCNEAYRRMQSDIAEQMVPGTPFEAVARARAAILRAMGEADDIEAFVRERVARHRNPVGPIERRRADGGYHIIREVRAPSGETVVAFTDISELKQREQALRESEERYRRVVEMSPSPILLRRGEHLMLANPAAVRFFGANSAEDLTGMRWLDLIHPDEHEIAMRRIETIEKSREPTPVQVRKYRRLDGQIMFGETSGAPFQYQGQVLGLITIHDVTERRKAAEALANERNLLRSIIDNLPDWIYVKGPDYRYLLLNARARELHGLTSFEEVVGKTVFDLFPLEFAKTIDAEDRSVLETGQPVVNRERSMLLPNGDYRWYLNKKVPLPGPEGHIAGVIGINVDVTEIRKSAEMVRQLNAELEQRVIERTRQLEMTNKELESFAYAVSHDLRAPLRSIDGFSQALLEDYGARFDATGKDYLRRVRDATQRMAQLIDDLLALSRVARAELRRRKVDLSRMVKEIAQELARQGRDRDVALTVAPGLTASADPNLLRIALQNLLDNAWKFTARRRTAKVEVGVTEHRGRRAFFVRDNGVGFDMAYYDRLFGAFQRLHNEAEFPGTGVGLATVQRIMRRHGGEAWAESAVDRGSTFYFTLESATPVAREPARG